MASLLQLEFATIMAPADRTWWYFYGVTGDQVGHVLTQNKAMLTRIRGYVDTDNAVKFAVVMEPANQTWWWYYGVTGDQVGELLAQNKAQLTDISAYVDTNHQLKFAVIMVPTHQEWWWYYGVTGDQVGQLLTQNRARLTAISPFLDTSNALKYAVIMAPADQTWWWYPASPADQVGQLLTQNRARLTAISPFLDTSNALRYAVIMAPADQTWWWCPELNGGQVGQNLNANKARLTVLSPYVVGPPEDSWSSGTGSGTTDSHFFKCAYTLNLTLYADGTCHFWGQYSNRGDAPGFTAPPQTFGLSMVVLDANGKLYSFSVGGKVPSAPQPGFTYTWDQTTRSAVIAANWRAIIARNSSNYYRANSVDPVDVISQIGDAVGQGAQEAGTVVSAISAVMAIF